MYPLTGVGFSKICTYIYLFKYTCMVTKLTLTIEEQVIRNAKKYAQKKGCSLSGLVENYLKALAAEDNSASELTPRIRRLKGSIQLPADFDYKQKLEESISQKYSK